MVPDRVGAQPEVVAAFWKGIDVFRPIALGYAVPNLGPPGGDGAARGRWAVLVARRLDPFPRGCRRRTTALVVAEPLLAAAAILATRLVDSAAVIESGAWTVPTFWPAAGVVSAAVLLGRRGGLLAALFIGVVDVLEVQDATPYTINNIVLLLLIGTLIGYAVDLAREGHEKLRAALALEARVRERERLARTVHDGVLQTLAFINRRGAELGGEGARLGGLAADQERRLRALVTASASDDESGDAVGEVDLRALIAHHAGRGCRWSRRRTRSACRGRRRRSWRRPSVPRSTTCAGTRATMRRPGCSSRTRAIPWPSLSGTTAWVCRRAGWRRRPSAAGSAWRRAFAGGCGILVARPSGSAARVAG